MNETISNLLCRVRAAAWWASSAVLMLCFSADATLSHVVVEDTPSRTVLRLVWHGERAFVRERDLALASPGPGASRLRVQSVRTSPSALPLQQVEGGELPVARLEPAGRYRGRWIEHLIVRSHRVVGDRVERIDELVVEIDHVGIPPALPGDPVRERSLRRAVVNPGAVAAVEAAALRRAKAPPAVESTFARSDNWMRVEVNATGIYRIGYEDFAAEIGGASASRILASSIRVWSAPHPAQPRAAEDSVASWNNGYTLAERGVDVRNAESTLGPGDEVIAYLPGHEEWGDRYDPEVGRWKHFESLYADRLAYWISWDLAGDTPGDFPEAALRMDHLSGSPSGASVSTSTHRARQHLERNDLEGYGRVPDDWVWEDNLRVGRDLFITFDVPSLVTDSLGVLVTDLRGRENNTTTGSTVLTEELYVNRAATGAPNVSESWTFVQQQNYVQAPLEIYRPGMPLREGTNSLIVRNATAEQSGIDTPRLIFDYFSLGYRSSLRPVGGELTWVTFEDESSGGRWEYRLNEPGADWSNHVVLDTSDPLRPRVIDGGVVEDAGATLRFGHDNAVGARNHFVAVRRTALRRPLAIDARAPSRLLRQELEQAGQGWAMIVLYNGSAFRSAAETLVDFRRDRLPEHAPGARITAVDVQDVYDVFGHGVKEPTAIRNYLKFVQRFDGMLEYVCLVGDASRDYRNRLPGASNDPFAPERDQVPTFIQTQYPYHPGDSQRRPYAADDWFVCFDEKILTFLPEGIDLPDVAIGRLPAGNPVEARHLVDRILDYETNPPTGNWRNTVLMVADDEVGLATGSEIEAFHIRQAEDVSELLLDPAFNVDKLYLTEFPKLAGQPSKPAANQAMIDRWSEGRLIVHYIGHGSPTQMADENVFSLKDIPLLQNGGRLPLMLALSCDVAIFDSPTTKSMSEQLVLDERGGAIATIAATQVTFVSQNDRLTDALYPQLYPDGTGRSAPIGQALLMAKLTAPGSMTSVLTQHNNQKYVLFCDPALRLQSPDSMATLGGTAATEILSAQVQSVEGRIDGDNSASGRYYVRAHESAEFVEYPLEGDPSILLFYRLDGKTFFEGEGDFGGGVATANMISPLEMRFGDHGRVEVLMETLDGVYLATADDHPVRRFAVSGNDTEGPTITMKFLNDAHRVSAGDVLTATLEDSSGINVLGSAELNSIVANLDESKLPFDVTSALKLDEGGFTRGTLEIPVPDSADPGHHKLELAASDMLGNRTRKEIEFEVVAAGRLDIAAHAAFPNPFQNGTRFVVELNSPDPVSITIDIYSLDGRPIRRLERGESADGTYVLSWDGRDGQGDELANGTYIYAVRARFSGEQEIHQVRTGKIVRMR